MLNEIYDFANEKMDKAIESLKHDLATLRTGKVSVSLLDNIKVDYYGTPTPLNQVGSVTAIDATTIAINPWEKNLLKEVEKAIQSANIGVNPNNDGDVIKLFFPPMTEEERKKIAKNAKEFEEKAKIAVRNVRRDANDKVKKLLKDKEISEDENKSALDEVQKITDTYTTEVENVINKKIDDILKV